MNNELLTKLGIDVNLGLKDLLSLLEQKQFEYLERAQSTADDSRREEIEKTLEEIDKEIEHIKAEIKNAKTALVFDEGDEDKPAPEPEDAAKPSIDDKVEEMKKRKSHIESSSDGGEDEAETEAEAEADGGAPLSAEAQSDLQNALSALKMGDNQRALSIFNRLAEDGEAQAQHMLGVMYLNGTGTAKDMERAKFWIEKAAKAGITDAMTDIGYLYTTVLGDNKKECRKGLKYLKKAADSGSSYAMKKYVEAMDAVIALKNSYDLRAIECCVKRKHFKIAAGYCKKLSEEATDSFMTQKWLDKRKELRKTKPIKINRGSIFDNVGCGGGCLRIILVVVALYLIILLGLGISVYIDKTQEPVQQTDQQVETTVAAPAQ